MLMQLLPKLLFSNSGILIFEKIPNISFFRQGILKDLIKNSLCQKYFY